MARGWESKGVDEQQAEMLAASKPEKARLNAKEVAIARRVEGLRLQKQNIMRQLATAHNDRHRAMLQAAMAHLDSQLEELTR